MDSTLTLHLLNKRRFNRDNDAHTQLTSTERNTPSRHKATWIPSSAAKPWSSFTKNAGKICTI